MIAFLLSPLGRYLAITLAAVSILSAVYFHIRNEALRDAEAALNRQTLEALDAATQARNRSLRDALNGRLLDNDGFKRD